MPFVSNSTTNDVSATELPVGPSGDGFTVLYDHFKNRILEEYRIQGNTNRVCPNTIYSYIVSIHPHNLKTYMEETLLYTHIQIFHSLVETLYILEDYMSNSISLFQMDTREPLTDETIEEKYTDILSEIQCMYVRDEIIYSDITSYCDDDILQYSYRRTYDRIRRRTSTIQVHTNVGSNNENVGQNNENIGPNNENMGPNNNTVRSWLNEVYLTI